MSLQESGSGRRGYYIHRAILSRQDGQQRCGEHHVTEKGGLDYKGGRAVGRSGGRAVGHLTV
jgi:hypothetical protein